MRARYVVLVALLSCGIGAGCQRSQAKLNDAKPDEVLVTLPTMAEVTDFEDFIGHTDAMFSVEVRARVNGYLDKVNFDDGAEIEKGALLFEIDSRPYQATHDQTLASLEQGKARLIRYAADHRRADRLIKSGNIAQEEYDRIQGDFAETKATIGAAQAMLDIAQLNLDWTKVTAPIGGRLSRRMVDPGNLIKADDTLLTTIVSLDPMYVNFDIDERTLLKLRRLIASGRIKSRAEAEVPVLVGLSDEVGEFGEFLFKHEGTINFSDNKLDASTGTLRLRGLIANPKGEKNRPRLLSPGMYVRVRLPVGTPHKSIMISEEAIGTDQGRKFIYVVEKGQVKTKDPVTGKEKEHTGDIVVYRPIKVGSLNKQLRVVDEGLKLNERVIVSGLQRVRKGKEVLPKFVADISKPTTSSTETTTSSTTIPNQPQPTISVDPAPSASPAAPTPTK